MCAFAFLTSDGKVDSFLIIVLPLATLPAGLMLASFGMVLVAIATGFILNNAELFLAKAVFALCTYWLTWRLE